MVGHKYTDEEKEFLKNYIPGHTVKEITAEYNRTFKEPITESRVKGYMRNHKIKNGFTGRFEKGHVPANKGTHPPTVGRMAETQFKKGGLPPNTKPIGYERVSRDGYLERKVAMRPDREKGENNFKLVHRIVYEEHFGPIPAGHVVAFKDGDKMNVDPDNLILLTREEHVNLTRYKLRSNVPELTETGVAIVRAGIACRHKRKERKKECNK